MARALHNRQRIPIWPTKPSDAVHTGEVLHRDGREYSVYLQLKPFADRSQQVLMMDRNDEPVLYPTGDGRMRQPKHRVVHTPRQFYVDAEGVPGKPVPEDELGRPLPVEGRDTVENDDAYREFIIEDLGNGTDQHNYYFREDPAVQARKLRATQREDQMNKLLDAMVDGGIDADTLTRALADVAANNAADAVDEASEPPAEVAAPETDSRDLLGAARALSQRLEVTSEPQADAEPSPEEMQPA